MGSLFAKKIYPYRTAMAAWIMPNVHWPLANSRKQNELKTMDSVNLKKRFKPCDSLSKSLSEKKRIRMSAATIIWLQK
jgi:hypothetical protein